MKWIKNDESIKIPIKSWCENVDNGALEQAVNLANHPVVDSYVALMPDCHVGYGMPIGGVIASKNAVIPNAVGVDIGCGMGAVMTDFDVKKFERKSQIREILNYIKQRIPIGEGNAHKEKKEWNGFSEYLSQIGISKEITEFNSPKLPGWLDNKAWILAAKNLGTLGGGNHFIEMQKDNKGFLWLMLHSGSRNLGHRIASYYHKIAIELNEKYHANIPDKNLAFLPVDSEEGQDYIRDMNFALLYAKENRNQMMIVFKKAAQRFLGDLDFLDEINIHHNYAAIENHYGQNVWIHRKGATSAKKEEMGIIPGSMGTSSYIVSGLGNHESYMSCSHGAGRKLGRMEACRNLNIEDSDRIMNGIVYDRWNKLRQRGRKNNRDENLWDLGESPLAYKDIDEVIQAQLDLIDPLVKLRPLGVIKG